MVEDSQLNVGVGCEARLDGGDDLKKGDEKKDGMEGVDRRGRGRACWREVGRVMLAVMTWRFQRAQMNW